MDWVNVSISLIGGILGGIIAGSLLARDKQLHFLGHIFCGMFGGLAGNYLSQFLGIISSAGILGPEGTTVVLPSEMTSILANGGISAACGAVLTLIVGWIKGGMQPTA